MKTPRLARVSLLWMLCTPAAGARELVVVDSLFMQSAELRQPVVAVRGREAFVACAGDAGAETTRIVRVDLDTFRRDGHITVPSIGFGMVATSGPFGFFVTRATRPHGKVVRVNLQTLSFAGEVDLPPDASLFTSVFAHAGFVYLTACADGGLLLRYGVAGLSPAGRLRLPEQDGCPTGSVAAGESAFLTTGSGLDRVRVVEIDPNALQRKRFGRVSDLAGGMETGLFHRGTLFFGSFTNAGVPPRGVIPVSMASLDVEDTIEAGVNGWPEPGLNRSVQIGRYGYFLSVSGRRLVEVDLENRAVTADFGGFQGKPFSIATDGSDLYVAEERYDVRRGAFLPSRLVRMRAVAPAVVASWPDERSLWTAVMALAVLLVATVMAARRPGAWPGPPITPNTPCSAP